MTNLDSFWFDKVANSISEFDLVSVVDNLSIEIQVGGPEGHVEAATQNQDQ